MNPVVRGRFPDLCKWASLLGYVPLVADTHHRTDHKQDIVEVEEWNEFGELKQHVNIVHDAGTPAQSAAPTPSGTPSKAPVSRENKKPETTAAELSKAPEPAKSPTADVPSSITLALRQAGQEAAQKAKDSKKKAPTETFDGVGEAEPVKETTEKAQVRPAPIAVTDPHTEKQAGDTTTSLQSPNSTTWKAAAGIHQQPGTPGTPRHTTDSIQSPNSTAWKPTDIDRPITMHRGSSVSQASAEEIRQIEQDETIEEEDEDAVED